MESDSTHEASMGLKEASAAAAAALDSPADDGPSAEEVRAGESVADADAQIIQ